MTLHYASIPSWRRVSVLSLVGPTHTGKTRMAVKMLTELVGEDEIYTLDASNNTNTWWDGYCGQKAVIIDDFYGWIKYGHFLRVLDGYKIRLEVKGVLPALTILNTLQEATSMPAMST